MATGNTFGGKPLLDPARLLAECLDRNLPTYWHGEVTVASCPPGREPGKAAFLMGYGDVKALGTATDHSLVLSNGEQTVTLVKWTVAEAFAPVSGNATSLDDNTTYLVRAVDRRFHLRRSPFSQCYNCTTDGTTYVAATTNSGTPWTWATMFANLWAKLPGPPTAPTLPFTPDGTPQNFNWFGSPSAWDALNDLLDRLACIVCYDPIADAFTVERLGTADAAAVAFEAKAKRAGTLNWDTLPVAFERADKPESLRVVFRRYPAPSAGSDPTYAVTTSLSGTGVVAGTVVQIEDDACAIGATGTPSNSAALATRAAERVSDYKRKLAGYDRRLIRSYRGLWKEGVAAPGSTYAALTFEDRGAGYATELQAKPDGRIQEWRAAVPVGGGATVLAYANSTGTNNALTTLASGSARGFGQSSVWVDLWNKTVAAGSYIIVADLAWSMTGTMTAGQSVCIEAQLYNNTSSSELAYRPLMIDYTAKTFSDSYRYKTATFVVTVAASTDLRVRIRSLGDGPPTLGISSEAVVSSGIGNVGIYGVLP